MFGRAGRNGCLARAHLLYTIRQAGLLRDISLKCLASEGSHENCRRKEMLKSLGSSEAVVTSAACCDVCSPLSVASSRLDVLVPLPLKRPRKPKPVRHITDDMADALKVALFREREKVVNEFPGYKMMGNSFLVSDSTIRELCSMATTLRSVDDLNGIVSLRPELRNRYFHVLWNVVSCAPSPKKRRRKT